MIHRLKFTWQYSADMSVKESAIRHNLSLQVEGYANMANIRNVVTKSGKSHLLAWQNVTFWVKNVPTLPGLSFTLALSECRSVKLINFIYIYTYICMSFSYMSTSVGCVYSFHFSLSFQSTSGRYMRLGPNLIFWSEKKRQQEQKSVGVRVME